MDLIVSVPEFTYLFLIVKLITKTRLYKYIVNFTAENTKILR